MAYQQQPPGYSPYAGQPQGYPPQQGGYPPQQMGYAPAPAPAVQQQTSNNVVVVQSQPSAVSVFIFNNKRRS